MPTIEIWKDTIGAGHCRGCQAPIQWAEVVESGAKMCFDRLDVVSERVFVFQAFGQRRARMVLTVDLSTNHWATCPHAKQFKRR